jgi:phosphinothricin acetyltransferase
MIIRQALPTDIPAVLSIYNDMILHTTAVYDVDPHTIEQRMRWYEERTAGGYPVLVAEHHDQVIGFASYGSFRPWQGFRFTVEHAVYVSTQAQGKGVGRQLLEALLEYATQQGVHVMVAGIDAANYNSIQLHEKLGFVTAGILREVGHKFDRWLDLQFMTKQINSLLSPQ